MQYDYAHREQIPVYANGLKDVPDAFRRHHWMVPVKFDKLLKLQLKVRMCCQKCEEKVKEEIWEVPGVFDVQVVRPKTVIVVAMPDPFGVDEKEVLRKAKKIDCRAKFVMLDKPPPKPEPKLPPVKPPKVVEKPEPGPQPPSCWEPLPCWPGPKGCPSKPQYCEDDCHMPWPGPKGCPSKPCPSKPQYCEDDCHMHYFHLLLLALFVFMLGYTMR